MPVVRNIGSFSQLLIDEGLNEDQAPNQVLSSDLLDFNLDLLMADQQLNRVHKTIYKFGDLRLRQNKFHQ